MSTCRECPIIRESPQGGNWVYFSTGNRARQDEKVTPEPQKAIVRTEKSIRLPVVLLNE